MLGLVKTREGQGKWRCLQQSVTSIHIGLSVFHVDSEQLEARSDVVSTFVSAVSRCLTEQVLNQMGNNVNNKNETENKQTQPTL